MLHTQFTRDVPPVRVPFALEDGMTGELSTDRPRSLAAGILFIVSMLLVIAASASAQVTTANLSGVVTDPSQAPVPGATVVARNQATSETRETTTNADGRFTLAQLSPGTYEVTAELTGFKRFRQVDLPLRANQSAELSIPMEVGGLTDEVRVTASSVALDTRSANQSVTLTGKLVSELPQGTRNPFSAIQGLAGTTGRVFTNTQNAVTDQLFNGFALNGGRDLSNLILIDGAPATAGDWGGLIVSPSPDSVQEMQVARNAYDAEFGRSGGGVVNVITKGGSSQFRGGGWEFFRNDALDANSWQNNASGTEKADFTRHQFGGQLGGPLWQSKNVFFYGSYEGLRETYPYNTDFQRVPTELERAGDFSQTRNPDGSLAVVYNPFTTRPDPANPGQFLRDPFPGNRIPSSLIDPVASQVLALYPLPNRAGDPITAAGNFFASGTGTNVRDEFDARVDWARSPGHTMYGRVSVAPRSGSEPPSLIGGVQNDFTQINPRGHASISNTFIPNSQWVINVLVGGGYWREEQRSLSFGVLDASDIGLSPDLFQAPLLPQFNLDGYMTLGNPQIRSFPRATYSLQANATRQLGTSHSIRFGFWGESNLINNVDRFTGRFGFGRGMTSGPVAQPDSSLSGDALASLLLGVGSGGESQFRADMAASLRYYAGERKKGCVIKAKCSNKNH